MMIKKLEDKLFQRKVSGNLRVLPTPNNLVDFCSNDYLGLAANPALAQMIESTYHPLAQQHSMGATGSRLISGNSVYYEDLESYLSNYFAGEACLIFNSGYTANMGVLSALPQRGDTILYDELSHSSIKDGIRLSLANRFSFLHNDVEDLESKLRKASGDVYIVVESVYSMDGDLAPLAIIVELCQKYGGFLVVDEAHSTGLYGSKGNGLVNKLGLSSQVPIRIHTFGKAVGTHGACVICPQMIKDYLINFSRPFIYTTALPLHNLVSIKCAIAYIIAHPELQIGLQKRIEAFKSAIRKEVVRVHSSSAIQAVLLPGNEKVKSMALEIHNGGFNVKPILTPTVKEGHERLRICLHTYNSMDDITNLCGHINSYY